MNRCTLALGLALALPALAQTVRIPPRAQPAELRVLAAPLIEVNGQADRLSPGARIRSVHNALVMPASLSGQRLQVALLREGNGLVHEVWILAPGETWAGQSRAEAGGNFRFESDRTPGSTR